MKLPNSILRFFADIYLHKYPNWILYKPSMHLVKGTEIRQILNNLKDGDVLLRTFNGYLNTTFTPGFWSHAAIYVGNNIIIHAIGEGVVKADILDFCRTDSVAIIRVPPSELVQQAIDTANNLVIEKTQYDYDFQDNNGKVYCTEFINICFSNLFDSDYKDFLGKHILLPDGIYESHKSSRILEFIHT